MEGKRRKRERERELRREWNGRRKERKGGR